MNDILDRKKEALPCVKGIKGQEMTVSCFV